VQATARKPRADSQRNRERLLEAAKLAFSEQGPEVSLEEIARRAGLGIGTLYRHFPNRDAIVADVYRHGVEQLARAATRLLEEHAPAEALHEWMRLFIEYIGNKKVMASALNTLPGGTTELYAASGPRITEAITLLVDRSKAEGSIPPDTQPLDLLQALVGFAYINPGPDWQAAALRVVDILMAGLTSGTPALRLSRKDKP
jgi:AcrR family transcriptional regulator